MKKRKKASHVLSVINGLGSTQNMSNELKKIDISFDFPKPVDLIEYLLSFYDKKDAVILDSFAGSGTLGQAVLNMNNRDNGNRKFILIEMEDYAESLTAQRVKKVITGYGEGKNTKSGTGGSFEFYELGSPLFLADGNLNKNIPVDAIREYIWFMETKLPLPLYSEQDNIYYLGMNNSVSYYFYYDKHDVTTLNHNFLREITVKAEGYIIYADICTLSEAELFSYNITFKKIPRDIEKL